MSQTLSLTSRSKRRRPGGPRRWTAADKAHYLAAFAKRALSIKAFCDEVGVPRATFTLWQHEARTAAGTPTVRTDRATPSFARVEVVAPGASAGLTLVVRTAHGLVAELAGLDSGTAVTMLRTVLARRLR